jgi:hypothetical protein
MAIRVGFPIVSPNESNPPRTAETAPSPQMQLTTKRALKVAAAALMILGLFSIVGINSLLCLGATKVITAETFKLFLQALRLSFP